MMVDTVEETIEKLKLHVRARNEADLARHLRIKQSTISSWKSRGNVPDRFMRILDGESSLALASPPMHWAAHERAALGLALVRYARAYSEEISSGDFEKLLRLASNPDDLWALFRYAQKDLMHESGGNELGLENIVAVHIHKDIKMGHQSITRDRDTIKFARPSVEWSDGTVTDPRGKKPRFP